MDRRPIRHGTRHTYQRGCRCRQCRWAEATYRSQLRKQHTRGQHAPGERIPARSTWRLLESLRKAGYTKAQIARFLGLKRPILDVHPTVVERGTALRIQAVYEQAMAEGSELPV